MQKFFVTPAKGPQASPKVDKVRMEVIALRKQNLSIYDISGVLEDAGNKLSPAAVPSDAEEGGVRTASPQERRRPTTGHPTRARTCWRCSQARTFLPQVPDPVRILNVTESVA